MYFTQAFKEKVCYEHNLIIIKSAYFPYKQIKLALHSKGHLQAGLKQERSPEDSSVSTNTVKTGSSVKNPKCSKTWTGVHIITRMNEDQLH